MNEIDEQRTSTNSTGAQFLLGLLIIASLFVVNFYFDLGKNHNDSDELVTLSVKASDIPEHIPYSKYDKIRYSLKAQEFNCRFWITDAAYTLIKNNRTLRNELETIKRGDDLTIVIYKSEEKDINKMYFKGTLVGLSTNDKLIFTPEEVRLIDKDKRDSNLWTASIVWIVILTVLVIVRFTKDSK